MHKFVLVYKLYFAYKFRHNTIKPLTVGGFNVVPKVSCDTFILYAQ